MAQTNSSRTNVLKTRLVGHIAGQCDDATLKRGLAQAKCDRNYLEMSGQELEAVAIGWLFKMTKGGDADVMELVFKFSVIPGFAQYMNAMMMSAFYNQ